MGDNGSHSSSWFVTSSIHPLFLSQLSPSADLAVAVFLIFTGVSSVLGNSAVLVVYSRKRKKLRPPEFLTINLALCDLGFSLLGVPFFIISSLCHAWVFGDTGCLWYGIQGFVFGIGSLLTTCLISLDRCLKICCLRYGQWIERRHMFLSIAVVWLYTLFWAFLPAFGFGSYGPEPYGISCTINWWKMRSSATDRIYIFLILALCFGIPALTIITSYLAILLTVNRSNRTLASIPSTHVSNTSKDLRLAKMAAVVCASFLLAWMPYAAVSLISTLAPKDDHQAASTLQTVVEESSATNSPAALTILDTPLLLNWTTTEFYSHLYYNKEEKGDITPDLNLQSGSSLPPWVTLIPAMFAKSHCMMNPLIYQIMNREFRDEVYVMVFGQEKAEKRRARSRKESSCERSISHSYSKNWIRRRSSTSVSAFKRDRNYSVQNPGSSEGGRRSSLDLSSNPAV
ncbi:opsin 9 [Parambassis ranga]|uniref:Opsin 9 n=1 Tax=Parambassis ranga TaxID=210632 RepID=A0A6P7JVX3_9TELE|nr:opsin-5-like [Parambassis ranga]